MERKMQITEVRIKLMNDSNDKEKLQAFCSITIDHEFVIRDLKIIESNRGWFVAMPSRKLMDKCKKCHSKNPLRSRFCNQCGLKLNENRAIGDSNGRTKLHADIAHPINQSSREKLQETILNAFHLEKEKSKQPGYVCTYDDLDFEYESMSYGKLPAEKSKGYHLDPIPKEKSA